MNKCVAECYECGIGKYRLKCKEGNSTTLTTNDNMRVAKSVQEVMVTLYREVAKQDHILDGTLFGVGSFWDGTRVVKAPNEFVICMFSVV